MIIAKNSARKNDLPLGFGIRSALDMMLKIPTCDWNWRAFDGTIAVRAITRQK